MWLTFRAETSIRDLATWLTVTYCKNVAIDGAVLKAGIAATVLAPNKLTPVSHAGSGDNFPETWGSRRSRGYLHSGQNDRPGSAWRASGCSILAGACSMPPRR
ncbi:MAG TPA: hypothetical protein VHT91_47990 [Kofleriaceae bacterium]|jgi:hypothetical protein|nr:hypothetical protein [Kofleriaceae bacterium]